MWETLEIMYNTDPMGFLKLFYYFILKMAMLLVAGYYLFVNKPSEGMDVCWKFLVIVSLLHLLPWR